MEKELPENCKKLWLEPTFSFLQSSRCQNLSVNQIWLPGKVAPHALWCFLFNAAVIYLDRRSPQKPALSSHFHLEIWLHSLQGQLAVEVTVRKKFLRWLAGKRSSYGAVWKVPWGNWLLFFSFRMQQSMIWRLLLQSNKFFHQEQNKFITTHPKGLRQLTV